MTCGDGGAANEAWSSSSAGPSTPPLDPFCNFVKKYVHSLPKQAIPIQPFPYDLYVPNDEYTVLVNLVTQIE
jgi:hypothetical protein